MNYYNEHDPKAAAWIRQLIWTGAIPAGRVDTRSITDVEPDELRKYNQCHFFAGIGGWPLALALAGVPATVPLWTGSCPCQPFSVAGKGKGEADERHLWPVFAKLVAQCRPPVVFGEQVASKAGRQWLDGVRTDLEGMGYAVGAADLCAAGAGAPHIRQRLYWVAQSESEQPHGSGHQRRGWGEPANDGDAGGLADANGNRCDQAGGCVATPGHDGAFGDGGAGRVAVAPVQGLPERGGAGGPADAQLPATERAGAADGVGDAPGFRRERLHPGGGGESEGPGRQGGARPQRWSIEQFTGAGAWSDFDLLPCLDGKTRRIESGAFPLAHGVPHRVGLLRGYGNAIVPQVAAIFIEAYSETTTHEHHR